MKTLSNLLPIFFFLISAAFILWQLVLISLALSTMSIGLSEISHFNSSYLLNHSELNDPLPQSRKIPKKIHFTWKEKNLSSYPSNASMKYWTTQYSDYSVYLWTNEDIINLIKEEYSWILPLYESYALNIQRADLARLLILYHEGGIYTDLDAFPINNSLDQLINSVTLAFPEATQGNLVSNHFFMASQHSPFLMFALTEAKFHNNWIFIPYLRVFASTGPIFVTQILQQWKQNSNERVLLFSTEELRQFVSHSTGRSWLQADGKLFNWIGDHSSVIIRSSIALLYSLTLLIIVAFIRYKKKEKQLFK